MTPSDEPRPPSAALVALTLFASYCLGANAAIALHELGHAVGCWLAGGKMLGLVLGPQGLSGSYAARDLSAPFAVRHGYLMLVAGGVVFGAAFGALLLLAARFLRRGTVAWIAVYAAGTWSIGNNGFYLLLGSLHPFGDALFLTEEGVPRWALFLAGLPLVVAFFVLFASFLRGIGLRPEVPFRTWALVVEAGLLLYLAVIFSLRRLWPGEGKPPVSTEERVLLACSPLALLLLAACTYPLRRPLRRDEPPAVEPRWASFAAVLALGLLFMAVEVLFFSFDYEAAAMALAPGR
jgi:hypothetical protein